MCNLISKHSVLKKPPGSICIQKGWYIGFFKVSVYGRLDSSWFIIYIFDERWFLEFHVGVLIP